MSKEESERARAEGHASSVPPRTPASDPPRTLPPSVPPITDDIDTDWGTGDDADDEVTRVVQSPLSVPPPQAESAPPVAIADARPGAEAVALPAPPEAASPPHTVSPLAVSAAVLTGSRRSPTLIGMAPPARRAPPADGRSPSAESTEGTDVPPLTGLAEAPVPGAVGVHPAALRSSTLLGLPTPPPPEGPFSEADSASEPLQGSGLPGALAPTLRASSPPAPPPRTSSVPPPRARISSVPPPLPAAATLITPSPPSAPPVVEAGSNSPREASVAPPIPATTEANTGFGRWLGVLGIAIVVVALIGYRLLARAPAPPASRSAPAPSEPPAAPAPAPTPPPAPVESLVAAPEAPAPPSGSASISAPGSAPAASAAAAEPPAATGESHRVTFKSSPPKARFFHFGKEVGTAPFTLDFKPGEHHAYEVGLPGYITRKVTVDGSKPEITVGLRKESR